MQRTRYARTRWLAKSLRKRSAAAKGLPVSRYGEKLPTPDPDYGTRAAKALARLMDYGSERVRLEAAKALLRMEADAAKREAAAAADEPCPLPVIQYVISGEAPELGPDDYDTRDQPEPPFGGLMAGWGKTGA